MSERYDHKSIESKWQKEWADKAVYATKNDTGKEKQYILDMFPYPSGEGLHVGHPRGYLATDVYSRMQRMKGKNVLHPMGWDAFGLPAENYALKNKVHPRDAVEANISRFKSQLSLMGVDYDWSREINTTDPEYYKWTQWIFLEMFKKGLAYESHEPINWCPVDKTGLANEDVNSDGTCERCGAKVEKRPLRQWVLKITDYADRLLADLDKLPKWPEGVKEAQRNWIGRKEGVIISHAVEDLDLRLDAFSAYPAWLFADTFLVIAPEHPLVPKLIAGTDTEKKVLKFIEEVRSVSDVERETATREKKGIFTGRFAIDPINEGARMPIWIANFALMGFGTGIIRCSSHDPRDLEFATKYSLPLKEVVERTGSTPVNAHDNSGVLKDSGPFTGKHISPALIKEMVDWFVKEGYAQRKTSYRIKDWVFSRQRYWGEPIPLIHCENCGVIGVPEKDLPVILPPVKNYEPTDTGESPLANITDWVNVVCPSCGGPGKRETNTMPQWAGSSWYYLRYIDPKNPDKLVETEREKHWMPVDVYVGGDHATRHLIYARFWHKFLYDLGVVSNEEPFPRLEFLGFILAPDGRKMSKRWGNIVNPDEMIERFGADAFRLYEMFIGPFENTVPWNTDGLVGTRRFIERVWNLKSRLIEGDDVRPSVHKAIKNISNDIEYFKFNTAVSGLMIVVNELSKEDAPGCSRAEYALVLKLLAPFAPHVTEELWHEIGNTPSIHQASWPTFDETLLHEELAKIAVQINGKTRGVISVSPGASEEEVLDQARADIGVAKWLTKEPNRVVYVPGKILNLIL